MTKRTTFLLRRDGDQDEAGHARFKCNVNSNEHIRCNASDKIQDKRVKKKLRKKFIARQQKPKRLVDFYFILSKANSALLGVRPVGQQRLSFAGIQSDML